MRKALIVAIAIAAAACGGGETSRTSRDIDPGLPPTGTAPADWPEGTLTVSTAEIVQRSGEPGRVALDVEGELPDPCHVPIWDIVEADGTITIDLRSASDPDLTCAQALQPFDITIPIEVDDPDTDLVMLRAPSAQYQFDVEIPAP